MRMLHTNHVTMRFGGLTAVSDFIKRIGDDSYLLENDTPLGLHLIMGQCIYRLKNIGDVL